MSYLRLPAEWMTATDNRLLEFLSERGTSTPTEIVESDLIRRYRTHVNNRLRKMDEAGLVNRVGYGKYHITNRGKAYLKGEADLRGIDQPDDDHNVAGSEGAAAAP